MSKSQIPLSSLLLLLLALSSLWAGDDMYNKDKIRPFISIGSDYRYIGIADLNTTVFNRQTHLVDGRDTSGIFRVQSGSQYGNFVDQSFAGTLEFGVEYDQMLFSAGVFALPNQKITKPSSLTSESFTFDEVLPDTTLTWTETIGFRDAELDMYGFDAKFGYMIFNPDAFFNIIPSIAFGLTFIDVVFPAQSQYISNNQEFPGRFVQDKPYTSIAHSITPELEARLKFGKIRLGGYIGYRQTTFDEFRGSRDGEVVFLLGQPSREIDMYYGGARVTWVWSSNNDKYQIR